MKKDVEKQTTELTDVTFMLMCQEVEVENVCNLLNCLRHFLVMTYDLESVKCDSICRSLLTWRCSYKDCEKLAHILHSLHLKFMVHDVRE